MRPLVARDLIAAYQMVVPTAVEIVNSGCEADPQVFFMQANKHQIGLIDKMSILDPRIVQGSHSSPSGKALLFKIVKAALGVEIDTPWEGDMRAFLAKAGITPHIAVYISEGWMAVDAPGARNPLLPSQRADRVEALIAVVHVREHSYVQFMPITTSDGKRHVELKPIEPDQPLRGSGRMVIQQDADE